MNISYNTLVVLSGVSLLGAAAGMVGAFAVLRRRALTGDALAHAALPGLCLAFMATGERRLPVLLLGAFTSCLLGNVAIAALKRWTKLKEDSALGIVLTVFFGAGIALSRVIQNQFPGSSKAGLDSFILGKTAGMTRDDLLLIATVAAGCLAVVVLLYKEFKLTSFDAGFARALGWPVYMFDFLLMALVAIAVVIGLPAVGVVMIASLLILPAAAARMWTDRLSTLLILSAVFGFAIGVVGTLCSASWSLFPAGPIIVLTGTSLFLMSLLFGTERGLLFHWVQKRKFYWDWRERQLLERAYELAERDRTAVTPFVIADIREKKTWTIGLTQAVIHAGIREGLVQSLGQGRFQLTEFGSRRALSVTRGRRLWEVFLREYPDLATSMANLGEESVAGLLPPEIVDELTKMLQREQRWPDLSASTP